MFSKFTKSAKKGQKDTLSPDQVADNAVPDNDEVGDDILSAGLDDAGDNGVVDAGAAGDQSGEEGAPGKDSKGVLGFLGRRNFGQRPQKRPLRDNEKLASVVRESAPGAAMEVLRANPRFALPNNVGWVILVLPTDDEFFGGLNAKLKKDEDKGAIINLVVSDDIHAVVTPDLLDNNALGLIPDEASFERMDEFSRLVKARYMYGVVTPDPDTGALMVFLVPPKRKESATGFIYEEARDVCEGKLDVEDVVDFDVIGTMIEIFHRPDQDGVEYGAIGVINAMDVNMATVTDHMSVGGYPETNDLLLGLMGAFSALDTGGDSAIPGGGEPESTTDTLTDMTPITDDVADGSEGGAADEGAGDIDDIDDDVAPVETVVDEPDFDEPDYGDEPMFSDDEDDFYPVDDEVIYDVDPERVRQVDEDEDEAAAETQETQETQPEHGHAAPAGASVMNLDEDAINTLVDRLLAGQRGLTEEQFETLRQEMRQSGMNQVQAVRGQVHNVDDREFSHEDVNESVVRRYLAEDLELWVNQDVFNNSLTIAPLQITLPPDQPTTPWLGEQLELLVEKMNGELIAARQRNYEELRRTYIELMDKVITDITARLSLDNKESEFYELKVAIENDASSLKEQVPQLTAKRRHELTEEYEKNKTDYAAVKAAQARQEYDHQHMPTQSVKLRAVEADIINSLERVTESNYAELNKRRRTQAGNYLDRATSVVIEELTPVLEKHQGVEREMYDNALKAMMDFVDSHRQEDIHQANVTEAKLAADNRVEQVIAEYSALAEDARAKADAEVDAMSKKSAKALAEYLRESERKDEVMAEMERRTKTQVADANKYAAEIQARADERIAQNERDTKAQLEAKDAAVLQAQANADQFIESGKTDNTVLMIMIIVIAVVALLAGLAVGVFLL